MVLPAVFLFSPLQGISWLPWKPHCLWCWRLFLIQFFSSTLYCPWMWLPLIHLSTILLVLKVWHWKTSRTSRKFLYLLLLILSRISLWSQRRLHRHSDLELHDKKRGDSIFLLQLEGLYHNLFLWFTVYFNFFFCTPNSFFISLHVALVCFQWGVREIMLDSTWCESGPCWEFFVIDGLYKSYFWWAECWLVEVFDQWYFWYYGIRIFVMVFSVPLIYCKMIFVWGLYG